MPEKQMKFINRVQELVGNEYGVLGVYEHSKKKVKITHNKCGHKWGVTPNNFLNKGSRCPECARKNSSKKRAMTQKDFFDRVRKLTGVEYVFLERYKTTHEPISVKHSKCGNVYRVRPSDFFQGYRCPTCAVKRRAKNRSLTHEVFLRRIKEKHGGEIRITSEYNNYNTKIEAVHESCGNRWTANPGDLLSGTSCPKCNESKGERRVSRFLDKLKVNYKTEYRIDECRDLLPLPFDFAVFLDRKLVYLIEYEGEQHFIPAECWGGIDNMLSMQRRDEIKRDYCKKKNIPLIEIPYWDMEEIENILGSKLAFAKHEVIA